MALTKKPVKTVLTEAQTEQLIKGGALEPERKSAEAIAPIKKKPGRPKKVIDEDEEQLAPVQLRLNPDLIEEIDTVIKKRIGKISRHTWFLEAISEKLQREQKNL